TRIWDDLGAFFVSLENGDPRPDEQSGVTEFISYKFTSPYIHQKGIEYNDGAKAILESAPTFTLSLTCYARKTEHALLLASRLNDWFRFYSYEYLKENDLVVVSVESMTDRTTFLETGYDNRVGFDVIMRISDKVIRDQD